VIPAERERLREEYRRRDADANLRGRYSPGDPAVELAQRQLTARIGVLMGGAGLLPLRERAVLEVGCGSGGLLPTLEALGALRPVGVDLSVDRLAAASARPIALRLAQADAAELPFPDRSFDLVAQSTLISSVLDTASRRAIASEMVRVLRPGGRILWYDFIWNPVNRATRGIARAELARLFPGFSGPIERVTLAPPIARPLARLNPRLAAAFSTLSPLRSHYLALLGDL
jgi:SAM-dependent methyltransferase